jgi:hypothetical protein
VTDVQIPAGQWFAVVDRPSAMTRAKNDGQNPPVITFRCFATLEQAERSRRPTSQVVVPITVGTSPVALRVGLLLIALAALQAFCGPRAGGSGGTVAPAYFVRVDHGQTGEEAHAINPRTEGRTAPRGAGGADPAGHGRPAAPVRERQRTGDGTVSGHAAVQHDGAGLAGAAGR